MLSSLHIKIARIFCFWTAFNYFPFLCIVCCHRTSYQAVTYSHSTTRQFYMQSISMINCLGYCLRVLSASDKSVRSLVKPNNKLTQNMINHQTTSKLVEVCKCLQWQCFSPWEMEQISRKSDIFHNDVFLSAYLSYCNCKETSTTCTGNTRSHQPYPSSIMSYSWEMTFPFRLFSTLHHCWPPSL